MHGSRNQCVMPVQLLSDPHSLKERNKKTFQENRGGSSQPKWPTSATKSAKSGHSPISLDHFFGQLLKQQWDSETERFRGFQVDHQKIFGRLLNRKVSRNSPFKIRST